MADQTDQTPTAETLMDMPSGYRLGGGTKGWKAVYLPNLHQVWIHPNTSRRQVNRRVIFEEMSHARVSLLRPSQLYPLRYVFRADALNRGVACPHDFIEPLFGKSDPIEWFRDITEALYVAEYGVGRSRPVSLRHLPQSQYKELGKEIIATAIRFAESADPRVLPFTARTEALFALMAFLCNIVPHAPGQGGAILKAIESLGVPRCWTKPSQVFQHLIARRIATRADGRLEMPFSVTRPAEPHRNIAEMLSLLALILEFPSKYLTATAPAVLGFLTLGLATFRPVIWIRKRRGRISAIIEVWNDPLGGAHFLDDLKRTPQPAPIARCRCQPFFEEWVQVLAKAEGPYFMPFGRLKMFDALFENLPNVIRKHLVSRKGDPDVCPYCHTILGEDETVRAIQVCLGSLARKREELTEAVHRYPAWLLADGMTMIQYAPGMTGEPVSADLIARPNFKPSTTRNGPPLPISNYVFLIPSAARSCSE